MGKCFTILILYGIVSLIRGHPELLYANRQSICLVNFTNGEPVVSTVVGDLHNAAAVEFVLNEGYVFWTDINLLMIMRAVFNPEQQTTTSVTDIITTGLISPDGLACDWVGKKLYWADSETKRIEVSELDGSYRKSLYWQSIDNPRAIKVDPYHGYMFWTDWGENPKIERAGMDGTPTSRISIIDDFITWPNGLTIDYTEWRVYWADAKHHYIHSCTYDGQQRTVVLEGESSLPHPFALTMLGDDLYWTDWQGQRIYTYNKKKETKVNVLLSDKSPMDLRIFDARSQMPGKNPCANNNGGCSHLCLLSPIGIKFSENKPSFTCGCPTGVRLLLDQNTCEDGAQQLLIFARRTDLRVISLDTPDFTDVVVQLDNLQHAIAVDYDPVEEYVYWTDDEVMAIRRAFLNGTGQETLFDTEVEHPDGIAVDWIGRNLYWTDTGTDRIEVSRLNGTSRKILISENLDEPRALCLNPERGTMWWTDWGQNPRIETAFLDGTNRKIIIDTGIVWPNGIAVDNVENKIFWCDAKTDRIEVANLDGSERKVLIRDHIPHVFGFSLLGDHIYWTDWQQRAIMRANKNTGGNRTRILDTMPDLMGLKATNRKAVKGTNDCANNNGNCSHLCLHTPNGAHCACPSELEIDIKGKECIVPDTRLLFSTDMDINSMSLVTNHTARIPLKGTQNILSFDMDVRDDRIYWIDANCKCIRRAYRNASTIERIIEVGTSSPEVIALDWLGHNIYWTDSGTRRIEMARADGMSRRVLIWKDLGQPKDIALDPANGYMYWTDWSNPPKIERSWLDGTNRETIISDLGRASSVTIDYEQGRLYWSDNDKKTIESSNMRGENRRVLLSDVVSWISAIVPYKDYLYFADNWNGRIERVDKVSGQNRTVVTDKVIALKDMFVMHHTQQSGVNGCTFNNGHCPNLCLSLPDSDKLDKQVKCSCPTHYTLADDNTCVPPKSFLLFSKSSEVSRLAVSDTGSDSETQIAPDVALPIKGLRNVRSLDFDPVKQLVFWITRGLSNRINFSKLGGSYTDSVVDIPNIRPFDLAIDPYSHTLFYSCSKNNVINFTRYDMINIIGTVVKQDRMKPRYLAINPLKGHLYWTDNTFPTIYRSLYDDSMRQSLFPSGLSKPGPIAVDPVEDLLFWADLTDHVIECSDLSGGHRRVLLDDKPIGTINTILGITVYQKYLFWVDTAREVIGWMDKKTGKNVQFISNKDQVILTDIHAVMFIGEDDLSQHPCSLNNGQCSHLCVYSTKQGVQCLCPNNLVLDSDELTCLESFTCSPKQFACKTTRLCIPQQWRCDGIPECDDYSDEEGCPLCEENYFQCDGGECIPEWMVCNGNLDCPKRDDEDGCCEKDSMITCATGYSCENGSCTAVKNCSPEQFTCKTAGRCISKQKICDGLYDCSDRSDEEDCPACGRNYFLCDGGDCISDAMVCDGILDCPKQDDEDGCCENDNQIKCASGNMCYYKYGRCDGIYDCEDYSDELGCKVPDANCGENPVTLFPIKHIMVYFMSFLF